MSDIVRSFVDSLEKAHVLIEALSYEAQERWEFVQFYYPGISLLTDRERGTLLGITRETANRVKNKEYKRRLHEKNT